MIPNGTVGGKMIFVGTDIIEIERIRKALNDRPAFVDRILSVNEKELFAKKKDPGPFLAGRFAAKEAVLKCLGTGLSGLSWQDIEIIPNKEGAPEVRLTMELNKILENKKMSAIKISISHSRDYAMAVAVGGQVEKCGF